MASWVQVLYYSFAASALALGIGFLTSAVNVFFKDMAQIVSICLQFGMWLTPIMYHESMFEEKAGFEAQPFLLHFYRIPGQYADGERVLGAAENDLVFLGGYFGRRAYRAESI